MNRDIDFKIKRKEELVKNRIKLFKLLITLILFLGLIICVIKLRTENSYINQIGLNLSELYSIENYEYKKIYEKDDKQYLIIKRLGDKVYYEKQEKDVREYIKKIYYFEINQGKAWKVLESEKIILTDEYVDYTPEFIEGFYINGNGTYAENYALNKLIRRKPSDNILGFKTAGNKLEDGTWVYNIKLKTVSGIEETFFDKETFEPIKSVIETEKNGKQVYNISFEENKVTIDDFKIIDEYQKMKNTDYMEYKKKMGLDL